MAKQKFVTIVRIQTPSGSRCHLVDKSPFVIGRSPEADIFLTSSNLSRQHLSISTNEKEVILTDLGSSNGSFVNGLRLEAGKKNVFPLNTPFQMAGPSIIVNVDVMERPLELEDHGTVLKQFNLDAVKLFERATLDAEQQAKLVAEEVLLKGRQQAEAYLQEARAMALSERDIMESDLRKQVEEKAATLLKRAQEEAGEIREEAIDNGKLQAKRSMEEEIQTIQQEVHKQCQQTKLQAQSEADLILQEASQRAAEKQTHAERRVEAAFTEAKAAAQEVLKRAELEAEQIVQGSRQTAEKIREEAQKNFENIAKMARLRATETVTQADLESKDLLNQAQEKAQAYLEKQKEQAQALTESIRAQAKSEAEEQARQMIDRANAQLELINRDIQEKSNFQKKSESQIMLITIDLKTHEEKRAQSAISVKAMEDQIQLLTAQKSEIETEKTARKADVLQLAEQRLQLDKKRTELEARLSELQRLIQDAQDQSLVELDQLKKKQAEELSTLRAQTMLELKMYHQKEEETFAKHKHTRRVELAQQIEVELLPALKKIFQAQAISSDQVSALSQKIEQSVRTVLPEAGERTWEHSQANLPPIPGFWFRLKEPAVRKKLFLAAAVAAAVAGVVVLKPQWLKPLNSNYAEKIMEQRQQESLYNPVQTMNFANSYVENVLYLKDYVEVKMDSPVQERWALELNSFFFKDLHLSEDKMVKFIGLETSLIKRLSQMRASLDAKYLEEGMVRMRNVEQEETVRLLELLQTPENIRLLRLREKSFVLNEISNRQRQPAAADKK